MPGISLFIFSLLYSQNNVDGISLSAIDTIVKDSLGNIEAQGKMLNGMRYGHWDIFYEEGVNVKKEIDYENSIAYVKEFNTEIPHELKASYQLFYISNSNTYAVNSKYTRYSTNGSVIMTEYYKNGLKEGKQEWYFDNGELKSFYTYANDTRSGPFIEYYESGFAKRNGFYLHGNTRIGKWIEFDQNQNILEEGSYWDSINYIDVNFELNTIVKLDSAMNIISSDVLSVQKLDSLQTLYNSIGQLMFSQAVQSESDVLQISELPNGIYILKISDSIGNLIQVERIAHFK